MPGRNAGWRTTASTCWTAPGGWPEAGIGDVDGVQHTAEHIVAAIAPIRSCLRSFGLRALKGVRSRREATSMKAVPRRLLVLGGGSAGVEPAPVVRRLGVATRAG